jgi:hypothetical protein
MPQTGLAVVAVMVVAGFAIWATRPAAPQPVENPLANARFSRFTDWPGTEGGAAISPASGKGPEQSLPPGEAVWIPRGKMKRTIKNNNDADLSIVVVAIKP